MQIRQKIKIFLLVVSCCNSLFLFAQNEVINIAILPSEIGEGMPTPEFKEFENNIVQHLEKLERFQVMKKPADFMDLDLAWNIQSQAESYQAVGQQLNAPYFLQVVFGDTEWTSLGADSNVGVSSQNRSTPTRPPSSWVYKADLWITLNLYDIATGVLENSITINANSYEESEYRKSSAAIRASRKNAVSAAQKSLWIKVKQGLKKLFPLEIKVQKIINQDKKGASTILVNVGTFHGFKKGDQLAVFHEKMYEVRGQSTIRHIMAGRVIIESVEDKTAICAVKKGKDDIPPLLEAGKKLKCTLLEYKTNIGYYGF